MINTASRQRQGIASPLVVVNLRRIPLVLGRRILGGIADGDDVERHVAIGDGQNLADRGNAVFARIDARPDCPQPLGMRRQNKIHGRRRAIVNPVFLAASGKSVVKCSADDNRKLRAVADTRIGKPLGERRQLRWILDDDKLPRTLVHRRRRAHRGAQHLLDLFVLDGLGCVELADGLARRNRGKDVWAVLLRLVASRDKRDHGRAKGKAKQRLRDKFSGHISISFQYAYFASRTLTLKNKASPLTGGEYFISSPEPSISASGVSPNPDFKSEVQ